MRDVYQEITDQIITALDAARSTASAGEWHYPWHGAVSVASNALTNKPYHGINRLVLMAAGQRHSHADPLWATYRQWQQLGRQVMRGQAGVRSVLYKPAGPSDEGDEDERGRRVYIRISTLFNLAQTEGEALPVQSLPHEDITHRHARAEALIQAVGVDVCIGGSRAAYSWPRDVIIMPDRWRFDARDGIDATTSWYSTLLHELVHASGAAHRLGRFSGEQNQADYAAEELVAELGAAFLLAELGLPNMPTGNHAAYIENWLSALRSDKRYIFRAAVAAGKAADWLLACGRLAQDRKAG